MIRLVALLLVLGGIVAGALWPWVQINMLGNRIGELVVFERASGWQDVTIVLSEAENPVRIRLEATTIADGKLPPLEIPVSIRIRDQDGPLVATIVNLPTKGHESGPEEGKILSAAAPVFRVQKAGEHVLSARFGANFNDGNIATPDLSRVNITFTANAEEPDETHKIPAAVAVLFGVYLLIRSRRKKPPQKPDQMTWGRGA